MIPRIPPTPRAQNQTRADQGDPTEEEGRDQEEHALPHPGDGPGRPGKAAVNSPVEHEDALRI